MSFITHICDRASVIFFAHDVVGRCKAFNSSIIDCSSCGARARAVSRRRDASFTTGGERSLRELSSTQGGARPAMVQCVGTVRAIVRRPASVVGARAVRRALAGGATALLARRWGSSARSRRHDARSPGWLRETQRAQLSSGLLPVVVQCLGARVVL